MSEYDLNDDRVQMRFGDSPWVTLSEESSDYDTLSEFLKALHSNNPLDAIVEFNNRAGNSRQKRDSDDAKIQSQMRLLNEEVSEFSTAYVENDVKEMLDALADIIVVATGCIHLLGYDPTKVMQIVNDSNMSKYIDPNNERDLKATLLKYNDDTRYKDVYVDDNGTVWGTVVGNDAKKILKGVHYKSPQWGDLFE